MQKSIFSNRPHQNFLGSQNRKKFSHKYFISLRYVLIRENSFCPPQVFLSETLYLKLHETLLFFDGTWLLLLFDFRKTTMSTSFDIGRVVLLLLTWLLVIVWIHSILFFTARQQVKMAVVFFVIYQLRKHLLTKVSWISSCRIQLIRNVAKYFELGVL